MPHRSEGDHPPRPRLQARFGHACGHRRAHLHFYRGHPNAPGAEYASLEIGDSTYIGELNNLRAFGGIRIGAKCLISQGVSIIGSNHSTTLGAAAMDQPSRTDKMGVVIEDDVWIGANSVILPGVTIGTGAIVAAGSVVTSSVAAHTIVARVPAKFLKVRQ